MVNEAKSPGQVKLALSLIIGACLVWLTLSLGQWQTNRADEKQGLFALQARALAAEPLSPSTAQLDLDNLSYRKIELRGRFEAKALIYIDNRQINGRPAVQVIQGFRPIGAEYIIPVDRGLLPRNPAEPRLAPAMPTDTTLENEVFDLQGTILPRFAQSAELRGMQLGSAADIVKSQSNGYEVWSNFNVNEFGSHFDQSISNFVVTLQPVVQTSETQAQASKVDGFYHLALPLQAQVAKHKGYAFQWFTMSAVLGLLTLFFVYREFYKGNKK